MNETEQNPNTLDLEKKINEFMGNTGQEDQWKTLAKYAHQLSIYQIKGLCKLKYVIHVLKTGSPVKLMLESVYETYMEHMPNYRTALYMLQMKRAESLAEYLGKGIEAKTTYEIK